ncbi:YidB family protein [Brevundimonas sp. LjRoot202]|uniref:YidB family protein n=1 Tax=Brevundimonas sp. LjRoot202 TaxID=3342281 RepID=UPI003ECEB343
MGMLDDVMGGLGKDAGGGIADLLKGQGGLGGLMEKFGQNGLGDVAGSWVGKGANMNISPEQISQVLGSGPIADFARKLGVSPEQASETLAGLLPEAVDRLTPGGTADGADDLLDKLPGGVGDMIGGFLKR